MGLQGELLVLATGLLVPPAREHVRATRAIPGEIKATLLAALEREDPAPMLLVPERKTYFDRLVRYQPKYEADHKILGEALATDYQLVHQAAQQRMIKQRPITEYQTLVGPRQVPNSFDQDAEYALEVDTVESHLRLAKDLAAGACLPQTVALFAALFPATYEAMKTILREGLSKRVYVDEEWLPPTWLEGALRILFRVPFDAVVDISAPPPGLPAATTPPGGKVKLRPETAQTPGQSTLNVPQPRR
jgi:hypothetical protein